MTSTSTTGRLIRLGGFAAVMVILLLLILQAIQRPIAGPTDTYRAEFTDINGLQVGDDVRLYGVRIGTVTAVGLDGIDAAVTFALQRSYPLHPDTQLAIRYQTLTGKRYVDIQQRGADTRTLVAGSTIPTTRTVAAFDITTLFNGLQPVLAELTPGDVNQLATSVLAVINGDGTGLGPAVDAIQRISSYVVDRQQVVSTLIHNISTIAEHIGGDSGNAMVMLSRLTDIFVTLQQRSEGLVDFALTIPPVLTPTTQLLTTLGLSGDPNPDLNHLLGEAFPDPKQALDVLGRLPALIQSWTALIPARGSTVDHDCSHGAATAPAPLQILIGGQRITLCNP